MSIKSKIKSIKEELVTFSFWKSVRCEFLISLLYVYIGCGALTHLREPAQDLYLKVALTFGLAQATLMQCVGHISGAHMNPAITVSMLATGKIGVARALCYIIAQGTGALAGAGILYGTTPGQYHGSLGVTFIKEGVKPAQAFAVEFMVSFILVFAYFANLEPKRVDMGSRSLSVGLSVVLGHLFAQGFLMGYFGKTSHESGGLSIWAIGIQTYGNSFAYDYTGCGMNPARSFGPAVVTNQWRDHWVYWVGPIIGGIIGGFTYDYTQCSSEDIQRFRNTFRRPPKIRFITEEAEPRCDSPITTELSFTPGSSTRDDDRL